MVNPVYAEQAKGHGCRGKGKHRPQTLPSGLPAPSNPQIITGAVPYEQQPSPFGETCDTYVQYLDVDCSSAGLDGIHRVARNQITGFNCPVCTRLSEFWMLTLSSSMNVSAPSAVEEPHLSKLRLQDQHDGSHVVSFESNAVRTLKVSLHLVKFGFGTLNVNA